MAGRIKKIWNYKRIKAEHTSVRKKALKGLVGFLIFMFVLTLLSRAANAMTLPQVKTIKAQKRSIGNTVQADGVVEAGEEMPIFTQPELKIEKVTAQPGKKVKKGELLVQLDQQHLDEKIREVERELKTANLAIDNANHNQKVKEENRRKGIQQAKADYDGTADTENGKVDRAYQQQVDAQNALDEFYNNPPADTEDNDTNATKEDLLKKDLDAKKNAYEEAVAGRDEALRAKQQAVENSYKETEETSVAESETLKKNALEEKLEKYQVLAEQKGAITAPEDGIITTTDKTVVTGGVTPATSLMQIAGDKADMKFVATITKEDQKNVSLGNEVTLSKDNKELANLKVDSITKSKGKEDSYEVTVSVKTDVGISLYETATMKIKGEAKNYSKCIEKNALREGKGGKKYVLVLVEKDTILGKQWVAEELQVTVTYSNANYAALGDEEVTAEQKIILSSNKDVQAGDRVRLVEDEK